MAVIRWCFKNEDGSFEVHGEPTAADLIEYANKKLEEEAELLCCESDVRMPEMANVKYLLASV